jgi:hypothetical protein
VLRHPEALMGTKSFAFIKYGDRGKRIDLALDLADGPPLLNLRFHVRAPEFDNPETFEAAFIVEQRVRGVG